MKKYSGLNRYQIKMEATRSEPTEEDSEDYTKYTEEETINSMVPIWKKHKSELTEEDYNNFYQEKHYGFDKPLTHIHTNVNGNIRYHAIMYITETMPFAYYLAEYQLGLELYSNPILIMNKRTAL